MSFAELSLPGGVRGDVFQAPTPAPAPTEHGTPRSGDLDGGYPSRATSDGGTAAAAVYAGMFDGEPARGPARPPVTRPSATEPWRGTPWMTPEQIGSDDRMRKLIESNAHRPPIYGPTIPPPHARDTIGPTTPAAIEASRREAVWRATPEFNKGMPVDKSLRAKTDLEKINESGKGVNAPWKFLNQFSGALAPGASRGLPAEGGMLAPTPTPLPVPTLLPPHPID